MLGFLKNKKGKNKKSKTEVPNTISKSIPYDAVYENGMIQTGNRYSKSYPLYDINFKIISTEAQIKIANEWGELLGIFEQNVSTQVTLYNKTLDIEQFKARVLLEEQDDEYDDLRDEYNDMLINKLTGAKNNLKIIKVFTVSFIALNPLEAKEKFIQIDHAVHEKLTKIVGKNIEPLTLKERLEILNSIYNPENTDPLYQKKVFEGHEIESFSLENCAQQGITTKDVIAPEGLTFKQNHFQIGNSYARSYYIANYPTWIRGSLLSDFASLPTNAIISVFYHLMPQEDAIKMIKKQRININATRVEHQKKSSRSGIDPSLIAPDLQNASQEANELMNRMTVENIRLYTTTFVITLFAGNLKDLEKFEAALKMVASRNLLTVKALYGQQEVGFNTSLPLGLPKLKVERLMTSETVSALIPYDAKTVNDSNGMYYGVNSINQSLIMHNRTNDANPNGCILGMPGAGKSFAAKREILNVLLNTQDEVYIIDPESEYTAMARSLGGTVVKLQSGSTNYINPFDLNMLAAEGDETDPVKVKTDFIQTILDLMLDTPMGLSPVQKSIIGRCIKKVYEPYKTYLAQVNKTFDMDHCPTLIDFYDILLQQPEMEAQTLGLGLEQFVDGSMDIFSHHTNVGKNISENRFIVYDIKDIGHEMKETALQIALDHIWNKMMTNKMQRKKTWFYIDEFYLMMKNESSSAYITQIWKRARKWNGVPTAITQNVEDLLRSEDARTIINTSPFVLLLSQSAINRKQLSSLLNISDDEQVYISKGKPGMGLMVLQSTGDVIPFDDSFPTDTDLYKIMTTKPDEAY